MRKMTATLEHCELGARNPRTEAGRLARWANEVVATHGDERRDPDF